VCEVSRVYQFEKELLMAEASSTCTCIVWCINASWSK